MSRLPTALVKIGEGAGEDIGEGVGAGGSTHFAEVEIKYAYRCCTKPETGKFICISGVMSLQYSFVEDKYVICIPQWGR